MSSEETAPETYALIAHPTEPRVLLLPGDAGWTLLPVTADNEIDVIPAVRAALGLDVTVLALIYERQPGRHIQGHAQPQGNEGPQRVVAVEPHTPGCEPPAGARWVERDELAGLPLAVPEHREVIETWLREIEDGAPPGRVPWARPGWHDTAMTWVAEHLARLGHTPTGLAEQVRVSIWSTVYRVPTDRGPLYFKAASPTFGFEPALTRTLAGLFPSFTPEVLAVDADRDWMLQADGGASRRDAILERKRWDEIEAYLPDFAALQIAAISHVDALLATGCPDRRLARLPALFDALVAEEVVVRPGQEDGVPEDKYAKLRALGPEVRGMCTELASYGVPETLHNDDFYPGNVLVAPDGTYRFFDWAESAITHPFCSMMIALRWARLVIGCDDATLDRLRDAYLEPWTRFAPLPALREAFAVAHRLGYLCRTLTYCQLLAGLEPRLRPEYAGVVPYWLRLFLHPNVDPDEADA
jgi:hypothetical protein